MTKNDYKTLDRLSMFRISAINGPLVTVEAIEEDYSFLMLETVLVGEKKLLGEVITIDKNFYKVQVYEETTGLKINEEVEPLKKLLSVELGPGLLGNIFDGIQRPLKKLAEFNDIYLEQGIRIQSLDMEKVWDFIPVVQLEEKVITGQKIGYVQENPTIKHWILVPNLPEGEWKVTKIEQDIYTISDIVAVLENENKKTLNITMKQEWPVKIPRPYLQKLLSKKVFNTGQRVIDTLFPIMLGAKVSTPGPFGAGKTFTQQQIAKWSDAQIVVYVGCGERGNEMTEMVKLFPELEDPKTGRSLMERTCLIANTSNMPIAAREASIYTGITIAEYYRDMGYDVVLIADSTSRWAEALREISQRLGEMPSEEGYPAYLSSRVANFYERAGLVKNLDDSEGSITVIGTVSPPGGDFSDPMTQISLKNTQVFLALDAKLASKRHYPAINWTTSYSLYSEQVDNIFGKMNNESKEFIQNKKLAKFILSKEGELQEIVKIVGLSNLENKDRLTLEIGKSLREDYLQQNGFDVVDTYCSQEKMQAMLKVIIGLYQKVMENLENQIIYDEKLVDKIFGKDIKNILTNLKYQKTPAEVLQKIEEIDQILDSLE